MTVAMTRLGLAALFLALLLGAPRANAQALAPAQGALQAVAPPLALTASDGTGLELVSLEARAVVEDPLAFTELHLTFRNPEDRVREGRFRITLPPGAAISRFAMKVEGRWQEGEVVELQAARQAYEDFLHRRQDPALMESEAGNEFSARVFPIAPRATKELIVSYSQELTTRAAPYRLPLRGLPRLSALTIQAFVAKRDGGGQVSSLGGTRAQSDVVEVARRDFTPDRDFEVPLTGGRLGLRHDNLVVARVRPLDEGLPAEPIGALTVLFDTSASRAPGFADQIARLRALFAALRARGADVMVTLAAFDQSVEPLYRGLASGFGAAEEKKLRARRALGASDLDRALAWAAGGGAKGGARLLLITDGVATAGELDPGKLRARAAALAASGYARVDALAVGGIRDDERLARLVAALPRAGVVLDGAAPAAESARRLTLATRSGLAVAVEGAAWVWPQRLDGVQPGDELLVYADLPVGKELRVTVGGRVVASGALAPAPRPLLERAWVKARLARLSLQSETLAGTDADLGEALRKQIIELSTRHRVLTRHTALLVLETEADYARFRIDRRALADILTIGPGGLALQARSDVALAGPARPIGSAKAQAADGRAEEGLRGGLAGAPRGSAAAPTPSAPTKAEGDRDERGSFRARAGGAAPGSDEASLDTPSGPVGAAASRAEAPRADAPRAERAPASPPEPAAASRPPARGALRSSPGPAPAPQASAPPPLRERAEELTRDRDARAARQRGAFEAKASPLSPYEGAFGEVMAQLQAGRHKEALMQAAAWRDRDESDVLALVALGEAAEATGDALLAARAYGSIIDLFPGRADMRRFAGNRLERLRGAAAAALAVDTYRKAVEQRSDHPASHRLLAFALAKAGRFAEAFAALESGARRRYPQGRFAGVERVFAEDLGLLAAAWLAKEPDRASEIHSRLARAGGRAEAGPSLRFVLTWETDANDVDFHIHDGRGGHAFYSSPRLPSGGELYADVTTGYGPECFTVRAPAARRAHPYRLQAHYYRRGPMGYGMGKLQVVEHDGRGGLRFEERPFVAMRDGAFVDMGLVDAPRAPRAVAGGALEAR